MAETYLKEAVRTPESDNGQAKSGRFAYGSTTVQGWRSTQEDAHLAVPDFDSNTALFGVFDGHNGAEVAQYCAKTLPGLLKKNGNYKSKNYEDALKECFQELDDMLLKKEVLRELVALRRAYSKAEITRVNAPAKASGTTAVVALVVDQTIYVANLGDSRCILCRDSAAFPLSEDHKPDNESEKQRIEAAGGEVIYGRINYGVNVSRAIGDHNYKANPHIGKKEQMVIAWPDVKVEKLDPKTDLFFVMCCDGIWNSVANEELISYVHKRLAKKIKPLSKICEEVIRQILPKVMPKRGIIGKDNMTLMVIKLVDRIPSPKKSTAVEKTSSKDSQASVKN